jgi:hypothetical protein
LALVEVSRLMNIKEWGEVLGTPLVATLVTVLGYWARREFKSTNDRVINLSKIIKDKVDEKVCIANEKVINSRLKQGDHEFRMIMEAIERQGQGVEDIKDMVMLQSTRQQEATRVLGECLAVLCQDLGGNGSCARVQKLLDRLSEERLNIGQ